MTTFTKADEAYCSIVEAPGRELTAALNAARSVSSIDMSGTDITHAILLRLKAFFRCQEQIKANLGKIYAAPAADFFVETVCFFLKVVLEKLNPTLSVASEKNVVKRRGSMRPDISIWKGEELVSAIECKTQLGWNRKGWLDDFEKREKILSDDFQNARIFLLVMTGSNWPGFGKDERVGKQFFVILNKIWPIDFEIENVESAITTPIESLFEEILSHANKI